MKAVRINQYGREILSVEEINKPTPSENQRLVKVHAVSINPFDIALSSGFFKEMIPLKPPYTPGGDFSGVDEETGEEVFGTATILGSGSGSFAEFLVVSKDKTFQKPNNLSHEEAASLVLAGVSALQGIKDEIKLLKDQKILIHGGAGGIGHLAIQIAKSLGAFVATTASYIDTDFVKRIGADIVIDYKTEQFENKIKGFDAVFDTVGGETTERSLSVIKDGGRVVSMAGRGPGIISQQTNITPDRLMQVARLAEESKLKPKVTSFDFASIQNAWDSMKTHIQGKIAVKVVV